MEWTAVHHRNGKPPLPPTLSHLSEAFPDGEERLAEDSAVTTTNSPKLQSRHKRALDVAGEDEISWVSAAKAGDASAFEVLVRRFDRKVFRIAWQITRNHEDAEDVVQMAFLNAFRGLGRFQCKARFSTWLFRIAVNESLMKVRQRHGIQAVSIDDEHEPGIPLGLVDWRPNPERIYSQSELRGILENALHKLSLRDRTVVLLRDVEGLSTAETAKVMTLNISTVKSLLLRARLKLRTRLGRYFHLKANSYKTLLPLPQHGSIPSMSNREQATLARIP